MSIEAQNKIPDIKEQIQEISKNDLGNLSNLIFDNGNIDSLPFKEHNELKFLTEDKNTEFTNKLLQILPIEKLA